MHAYYGIITKNIMTKIGFLFGDEKLKLFRIAVLVVFIIVSLVFGVFFAKDKLTTDRTYPVIEFSDEELRVPSNADEEDFLKDVKAYDKKDGDLTDSIVIENISKFSVLGTSTITYAVCDNDNHVSTAQRKVVFTDYKSPEFFMTKSLCFSIYDTVDVKGIVGAKDCIDGDISNSVVVSSSDFENGKVGKFAMKASVSNSKGDSIAIDLPLYVEDVDADVPKIKLKQYLIYVDKGTAVDYKKLLQSATDADGRNIASSVKVESEYDSKKSAEGVYSVHYYATDSAKRRGHTVLTIVVRSN